MWYFLVIALMKCSDFTAAFYSVSIEVQYYIKGCSTFLRNAAVLD